jgi:hypothetical protein
MSYPKGTIKDGNIYIRCTICGDSDRRLYVAHMSVSLDKGVYYCFRCGAKGKLSASEYLQLVNQYDIDSTEYPLDFMYSPTVPLEYESSVYTQDTRYSLLKRHTDSLGRISTPMRNLIGDIVGYQFRDRDKRIETSGTKGYGYVGDKLVNTNTIRIVEGIYDVVYPNDVCVFGSITYRVLKKLKAYTMLLAPDGDIVHSRIKLQRFTKTVQRLLDESYSIVGVEVFNKDIDPGIAYEQGIRGKIYTAREFIKRSMEKLQ